MGILDSIEGMAMQGMSCGNDQSKVAGGFVQAMQEHPGGFGAVLDSFRNNGLGQHADAMQNGQETQATPDQIQTGLQGTGLLETVAERAGVSPQVAKVALAAVLPIVMAHFSQNGGQSGGQSALGDLLSRFI